MQAGAAPASSSSDTGGLLDLDTDSPYISLRSSRQNRPAGVGAYKPGCRTGGLCLGHPYRQCAHWYAAFTAILSTQSCVPDVFPSTIWSSWLYPSLQHACRVPLCLSVRCSPDIKTGVCSMHMDARGMGGAPGSHCG